MVAQFSSDDIVSIEETTVTVRSYRHRTTIPSKMFRLLDLKQGDSLRWVALKDGTIFVRKVVQPPSKKR
jgi:bifunctional DNA-binding transcriptional regulator/antitoxin component of YhaV-PrlF toxin-antitoxin module